MHEKLNVKARTAGKSPFSNDILERHKVLFCLKLWKMFIVNQR